MAKEDVKKEGWSAEDLGEESSYEDETEISRRLRRGNETVGKPDERDVAGAVPEGDTAHGREIENRPNEPAEKTSGEEPSVKEVP